MKKTKRADANKTISITNQNQDTTYNIYILVSESETILSSLIRGHQVQKRAPSLVLDLPIKKLLVAYDSFW